MAPRPDWSPGVTLPLTTVQLYAASSRIGDAWAVTRVRGGDARKDRHAEAMDSIGGPVVLQPDHAAHQGARAHTPREALLVAVSAALETALTTTQGCLPVIVIRVPRRYARTVAGLDPDTTHSDPALSRMRSLWRQLQQRTAVCLTAWQEDRGFWWGERSMAIADASSVTRWGPTPHTYATVQSRRAPLGTIDTDCPVCMEPFSDALPSFDHAARAPELFRCTHAVCMRCDAEMERRALRCGLCRAERRAHVHRRAEP